MTVRRDFGARFTKLLLQADGPGGVLIDHSRAPTIVTPGDFATDAGDQLFGVNSFTGQPTFPGRRFATTLTLEGFARFNPNGSDQTMLAAMSTTYYLPTECAWTSIGSNPRTLAFYNGSRGSSQSGGNPILSSDLPVGAWKHFFFCMTPSVCWWGVDGVMSPQAGCYFVSDHIGHEAIPFRLNGIDPAVFTQNNAGKLHSLMITESLLRYPFNPGGTYTAPDDLLTNWYQDTGVANDPVDPANLAYAIPRPARGGAAFQGGGKKIAGHLTYSGANAKKRVVLFARGAALPIAQTLSRASDGYFEFPGLEPSSEYFVIGFDDSPGTINAEIADHLIPG